MVSAGIEIVFAKDRKNENLNTERYRVESKLYNNVKDLLKNEIDNIAKKYNFANIISVKITG